MPSENVSLRINDGIDDKRTVVFHDEIMFEISVHQHHDSSSAANVIPTLLICQIAYQPCLKLSFDRFRIILPVKMKC